MAWVSFSTRLGRPQPSGQLLLSKPQNSPPYTEFEVLAAYLSMVSARLAANFQFPASKPPSKPRNHPAPHWGTGTQPLTAERRCVYSPIPVRNQRFLFKPKIDTSKTAEQYGLSKRWLEKARLYGFGPPFLKIGPKIVLYDTDTLDRWFAACERHSTSQTPPPPLAKALAPTPPANKPHRRTARDRKAPRAAETEGRRSACKQKAAPGGNRARAHSSDEE
jgi:hypothetical protein